MNSHFYKKLALCFFIFVSSISVGQVIYQHAFGTATFSAVNPYTVAPNTIDANLSSSQWATSAAAGFVNFAGSAGQALSLNNSSGTPTYSLSFAIGAGFNCDITAYSFWRQRSAAGAQNWTLTVNGVTTIGTGTVPTAGVNTGTLGVSSAVTGLSGTVNVVLQLGGASGAGTFRLDDFTLYGTVYSSVACSAPTIQSSSFASSAIGSSSATVSWASGNGNSVIVLAHQAAAVNASPVNGASYIANSIFASGQQIGTGNYVVFNGVGNSVNVTGLNAGTDYYFSVFEYNNTGNCYLYPALTGSLTTTGTVTSTGCLKIKSILVAACGAPESSNEMVYFQNGSNPLPINQISIAGAGASGVYVANKWPNPTNAWNGLVQNATTAANVAIINGTITACGHVLEPPQTAGIGIIPPFANVILVGSQGMSPLANSFVNLTDTVYMIFQTSATTTGGHFVNYTAGPGTRSFVIIDNLHACTSNSVTYQPGQLSNLGNGDAVAFDDYNNITYYNSGCQAPYIPFTVDVSPNQTVCYNTSAVVTATPSGTYNSITWSGGTGTFSSPSALTTSYTPGASETGTVALQCSITRTCAAHSFSTTATVTLSIKSLPLASLSATGGYSLCPSTSTILSYSVTNAANAGVVTPSWSSPAGSGSTYTVSTPSGTSAVTYTLDLSNSCGTTSKTFTVYPLSAPTVTLSSTTPTACAGSTLSLSASGNTGNYSWNNPASTSSVVTITASTNTTGVVTSTNSCGSVSKTYTLTVTKTPVLTISSSNINLCTGQSATITATSSEGTYLWQPGGATTNTLLVNTAGVYTVTTSNACFTTSATSTVVINSSPTLTISATSNSLCTGGQLSSVLSLSGSAGTYSWSTGVTTPSISVSTPGVYTATVTTATCGSASTSFTVNSIANPSITLATSSFTACPGNTVSIIANSSEGNYSWSGSSNTTATLSITATTSTTGIVTTTNACTNASANYTINVTPTPTLTVDFTNISLCTGQTATVTAASSEGTYLWQPGGITTNTLSVNTAGVYTVTTSNACFTTTATSTVVINSSPTLTITASSSSLCAGGQLSSDLTLNGSTGTYSWSTGASTQSISVSTPGVYTATVTTATCGSASTSFTVNSIANPSITLATSSFTACPGNTVSTIANSSEGNYSWSGSANTTATLSITASTSTTGIVTTTNACTSVSANYTINVTPTPTLTIDLTSISLCTGQTATVTATSSEGNYMWQPGGTTTNTLSVNTAGVYTVTTSNACFTTTATSTVVINSSPTLSITASSSSLCTGGQLSSDLSLNGSTGTYSWSTGASTHSISVTTPGIYTATVTTSGCGTATDSFTVNAIANPSITLANTSFTACPGNTVSIIANSSEGNYTWSGSANTTATLSITASTSTTGIVTTTNACTSVSDTYTITVTPMPTLSVDMPTVNICTGQSATVTATSSEGTYVWQPGGATTNTLVVSSNGVYTVSTSNACYTATATTTVSVSNAPSISISSTSPSLCTSGQTATLSLLGSSLGTYDWSDGSHGGTLVITAPGIYTATVTTASCGSDSASVNVAAISTPTITSLISSSNLLCNGVSATLTVNDNMYNEVWSDGSVNTQSIVVNGPGTYTVGVSNACGSPTASIVIQSNTTPNLTLTSSSSTLCPNETATLTVLGGSAPYSWSNSSNTGSSVTTNGGTVTVSNTNACGTGTASVVVATTNLNASVTADPTSGVLPVVASFTNNSTGATSYAWSFGNGNTAITQTVNPQTYSAPGTYEVYLTAFNGSCFDTDSLTITVLNENPWMVIPNVFTPNSDSINDVFRVTGLNITEFSCTIFDRWGLQMYAWDGIKNGWNGKANEKDVPAGTYFYIINAKDINDKEIKKQGYISLFR